MSLTLPSQTFALGTKLRHGFKMVIGVVGEPSTLLGAEITIAVVATVGVTAIPPGSASLGPWSMVLELRLEQSHAMVVCVGEMTLSFE